MKSLLAALILVGGIVVFAAIMLLLLWIEDIIKEAEWKFKHTHKRYKYFVEHILPRMVGVCILLMGILGFVGAYFIILSNL
jgi:peptidoglycan biosynthesis protein MviN/MurJ (putative lipid II flippase)